MRDLVDEEIPILFSEVMTNEGNEPNQLVHAYAGYRILILDDEGDVDIQHIREAGLQLHELLYQQERELRESFLCLTGGYDDPLDAVPLLLPHVHVDELLRAGLKGELNLIEEWAYDLYIYKKYSSEYHLPELCCLLTSKIFQQGEEGSHTEVLDIHSGVAVEYRQGW